MYCGRAKDAMIRSFTRSQLICFLLRPHQISNDTGHNLNSFWLHKMEDGI